MNNWLRLMMMSSLLWLASCKKPDPESCFTVNTQKTTSVSTVFQFNDCSENATRHEWNFDDGSNSDIASPSHVFERKGVYQVRLTVYNEDNKKDEMTKEIVIGDYALVDFDVKDLQVNDSTFINCSVYDSCPGNMTPSDFYYGCKSNLPSVVSTSIDGFEIIVLFDCNGGNILGFESIKYQGQIEVDEPKKLNDLDFSSSSGDITAKVDLTFDIAAN